MDTVEKANFEPWKGESQANISYIPEIVYLLVVLNNIRR
jgi:hypothetical protein